MVDSDSALAPYRALIRSRIRSQLIYRTSFVVDVVGSISFALTELVEVLLMFHRTPALGGLNFRETFLLFALGRSAFSLADLFIGQVDTIATYVRTGTLESLLVRPLPVLAQIALGDFSLRRVGRVSLYVVVLALALTMAPIIWTPAHVLLLLLTVVGGAVIFSAIFVAAGALQFRLLDGGEVVNSITYGGGYVATYSGAVLPFPLRAFFTGVVPALFTGYLPTLALIGKDGPPGWPQWLAWLIAPVAAVTCLVAGWLWRNGLHHYQGGGG